MGPVNIIAPPPTLRCLFQSRRPLQNKQNNNSISVISISHFLLDLRATLDSPMLSIGTLSYPDILLDSPIAAVGESMTMSGTSDINRKEESQCNPEIAHGYGYQSLRCRSSETTMDENHFSKLNGVLRTSPCHEYLNQVGA